MFAFMKTFNRWLFGFSNFLIVLINWLQDFVLSNSPCSKRAVIWIRFVTAKPPWIVWRNAENKHVALQLLCLFFTAIIVLEMHITFTTIEFLKSLLYGKSTYSSLRTKHWDYLLSSFRSQRKIKQNPLAFHFSMDKIGDSTQSIEDVQFRRNAENGSDQKEITNGSISTGSEVSNWRTLNRKLWQK